MKRLNVPILALLWTVIAVPPGMPDDLTIIYLDPAAPQQSWFLVAEWPSYLFMPNSPLRVPSAHPGVIKISASGVSGYSGVDLNCSDLGGSVFVGSYDPHRLDADGDGLGCE